MKPQRKIYYVLHPFIRIKIYFSCFEIHIVRRDNLTKFVISLLSTYTSIYTRTDTETPRSNREYIMRNLDRYSASQRPMDIVLSKHVAYTQRESRKDIRYTCLYYTLYIYFFFSFHGWETWIFIVFNLLDGLISILAFDEKWKGRKIRWKIVGVEETSLRYWWKIRRWRD